MARIEQIGSDFSGQIVSGEPAHVEVHSHPDRPEAPPALLDASPEEAREILTKLGLPAVQLLVRLPGEEPQQVIVDVKKFNGLFVGKKPAEVLELLEEAPVAGKKVKAGNGNGDTGRDYGTLEWAGTPKKGKTSPEEARIVRDHFDEVNARLVKDGMRPIDLNNPEHVTRYALQKLAEVRKGQAAPAEAPAS